MVCIASDGPAPVAGLPRGDPPAGEDVPAVIFSGESIIRALIMAGIEPGLPCKQRSGIEMRGIETRWQMKSQAQYTTMHLLGCQAAFLGREAHALRTRDAAAREYASPQGAEAPALREGTVMKKRSKSSVGEAQNVPDDQEHPKAAEIPASPGASRRSCPLPRR